jgi:hypothetical protein
MLMLSFSDVLRTPEKSHYLAFSALLLKSGWRITEPGDRRMEESMVVTRKHTEKPEDLCAAP